MEQKTVLITGGTQGIGKATALLLAQNGYSVVLNYKNNSTAAASTVAAIHNMGGNAWAVQADVAHEPEVLHLFETCDRLAGTLVGLVNNAAVIAPQSRLIDMTADRILNILSTNVLGSFLCAREAVKRMSTKTGGQGGSIVNVSSIASRIGSPFEYVDYAASKGAIDTFTLGLSKEVATEGIRVNAVRPGMIYTEIHAKAGEPGRVARLESTIPMQRGGQPEEIAEVIRWLLSEQASYVTGAVLDASGGR
jgi:NAD(P)-dependent dehydrogenase (short-subunit alcohol dehydrogenase family)